MSDVKNSSALACLGILFSQVRREVNFNALLTTDITQNLEAEESELGVLLRLSENQKLEPVQLETLEQAAKAYTGPALIRLTERKWVLIQNIRQAGEEHSVVIEPVPGQPPRALRVKTEELHRRFGGAVIVFRNLQEVDSAKQSSLFCLCNIAKHHGVNMDIRRVMHDYAIGEDEPRDTLFYQIAADYEFKIKQRKLDWKRLLQLGSAYPAIGIKKNGKKILLCGVRPNQDEVMEIAVIDPENKTAGNRFDFMDQAKFEEIYDGKCILLKKTYRLSDENQPFSLRWFIPEFLKLKGIFAQIALTVGIITLLSLVVPLFFQIVVDKVLVHKGVVTLNSIGIGIVCAIIFNGFMEFIRSYYLLFATNKIDISTAMKTFRHLMRLPIDFFERVPSGVLLKHMQQTERIRGFLSGNLFFTILDLCALCIFVPFLMFYSIPLTMIVLGYSALMALVIACLIKPFQARLNELYQAEGKRQSMLVESIHGIRTVKSLALEPVEEQHWDDTTAYSIKSYFRVGKISITAKSISQVLEMLMTITVIWVGALLVFDQKMSIGALIAFQMLSGRVTGPLVKMVGLIHEYQQIALSVKMLGVVMNTPTEPMGGGVRNPLKGEVTFDNVTFQYRPDLPQVIRNLSLEVPPGTTIGIVGRSGSGKTTLTKLLQGLYNVQQGIIKIDGIDIREIDKAHLRMSIGVVLQENYFFSGTVRENISMTKRSASLEEIIYASKLAGADEFVQKLPRGYDTVLEENASNLSGGQKQRLAIARALLTNPPILIFDEATSALDPESEQVIKQNLRAIARGRTVLIISHRLSIVSSADKILVLDNGERTAFDSHRNLLQQPGTYRDFWRQQMEPGV